MLSGRAKTLRVMTWNLYLGAPLDYTLPDIKAIPFIVEDFWKHVQATRFTDRAEAIVKIIAQYEPDIIVFQEAVKYFLQYPGDFFGENTQAVNEALDFIKILTNLLNRGGLFYQDSVINTATDIELPSAGGYDLRIVDRQVMMVKKTEEASGIKILNTGKGLFKARRSFLVSGLPFYVVRGWAYTDILYENEKIRIVTTHLEPTLDDVRLRQARELTAGACNTDFPLIVAGDFNAEPLMDVSGAYSQFMNQGFYDAWLAGGQGNGYTCCQDSNLLNLFSKLNKRIDWSLFKGQIHADSAITVGDKVSDKTEGATGLWPSDHAGVMADFILKKAP